MPWYKKAILQVADDATTADLVGKQSRTQRAVDGRIQGVAAEIISADPSVKAAAAAAVTADIAGRDLVEGSSPRVPTPYAPERERRIDIHGRMAFEHRADGKTFIADPIFGRPIEGGGGTTVTRVRLILGAGQSNMEQRAQPFGPRLDPPRKRLFMWHWANQAIQQATVPLSSQQQQVGFGILSQIGLEHLAVTDDATAVLIGDMAAGGSGLVAQPTQGTWGVDYAGPNPRLYNIWVAEVDKIIAAATLQFPGAVIEPWLYWHQGEADGLVSYGSRLDQLIAAMRTHLGDQTIPWTSGGLVPEAMKGSPDPDVPVGGHFNVRTALLGSQSRNLYCAYTDGVPNSGGSQSVTDTVHMGREGAVRLGKNMFYASMRAATATATTVPHKPLDVSATFVGGVLTVKWSEPITRYTNFVVEYRVNGGAWTTATRAIPEDIQEKVTGLTTSATVEVRVSTVNATLTSEPTIPVTALKG